MLGPSNSCGISGSQVPLSVSWRAGGTAWPFRSEACSHETFFEVGLLATTQTDELDGLKGLPATHGSAPEPKAPLLSGKPDLDRKGIRLAVRLDVGLGEQPPLGHVESATEVGVALQILIEEDIYGLPGSTATF